VDEGELSFIYRYILRESCSHFDSLPLTYLTVKPQSLRRSSGGVATGGRGALSRQHPERRGFAAEFACTAGAGEQAAAAFPAAKAAAAAAAIAGALPAPSPSSKLALRGGGKLGCAFIDLTAPSRDAARSSSVDRAAAGEFLLCTVTFHANLAHSLTRSP
jgi:hypothetical protein